MGVTVAEVEAVLVARNQMSAELKIAKQDVKDLEAAFVTAGGSITLSGKAIEQELGAARVKVEELTASMAAANAQSTQDLVANERSMRSLEQYGVQTIAAKDANLAFATSSESAATSSAGLSRAVTATMGIMLAYKALNMVHETADWAHEITNLSTQTDISTDKLQVLNEVGKEAGVEAGTLAKSISMLSKRIAGDDDSARNAMVSLGLSMADLKTMSPYDMFVTVADAIGRVTSQQDKAQFAMEAFGRGGIAMLSQFDGHIETTIGKIKDLNLTLDGQSTQALADLDKSMQRFGTSAKIVTGEVVSAWGWAWDQVKDKIAKIYDPMQYAEDQRNERARLQALIPQGPSASGQKPLTPEQLHENFLTGLEAGVKPLTDDQQSMVQRLIDINQLTDKNAKAIGLSDEQYKVLIEDMKVMAQQAKDFEASLKRQHAEFDEILKIALHINVEYDKNLSHKTEASDKQFTAGIEREFGAKKENAARFGLNPDGTPLGFNDPFKKYQNEVDTIGIQSRTADGRPIPHEQAMIAASNHFLDAIMADAKAADAEVQARALAVKSAEQLATAQTAAAHAADQSRMYRAPTDKDFPTSGSLDDLFGTQRHAFDFSNTRLNLPVSSSAFSRYPTAEHPTMPSSVIVNMSGLLASADPSGRAALAQLVKDAVDTALRQGRRLPTS